MAKSKAKRKEEEDRRAKQKDENWLIVYNPWYLRHRNRSPSFSAGDLQDMALWLQIIFGAGKVQGIQHKTNHKHIIAKVDLQVDIEPGLGQHDWGRFLNRATDYERRESSKIFEYDFIKYGDQSDKQWDEYYPLPRPPPHDFPVIRDYPAPSWCERNHLGVAVDWSLPLKPPSAAVDARAGFRRSQEALLQPHPAVHSFAPPSYPRPSPIPQASGSSHFGREHSSFEKSPSPTKYIPAVPSTRTTDPRTRPTAPLGAQHQTPTLAQASTPFRPYEPPTHYSSHQIRAADKPNVPVKREYSPIRVPYIEVKEEEEKLKHELSLGHVRNEEGKYSSVPRPHEGTSSKHENVSLGLSYPDSDLDELQMDVKPQTGDISVKTEPSQGAAALTQLVSIRNPLGMEFQPQGPEAHNPPPSVSHFWDWLHYIADGALALYFSRARALSRNQETVIVRLRGDADLTLVLGRHEWSQCLQDCPSGRESEVTTVTRCLTDPETLGLDRIDAPEPTEDYSPFRAPYPRPLPLLKDEDDKKDIKRKVEAARQWQAGEDDDVPRKRVKLEEEEHKPDHF